MNRYPRWSSYAFALLITSAMLVARNYVSEGNENRPMLILMMLPLILSSLIGGLGPGLTASAFAALGTAYFALPPYHSFSIEKIENLLQWSFLIISGVAVSMISEELRLTQTTQQNRNSLSVDEISQKSSTLVANNRYLLLRKTLTNFLPALALISLGGFLYFTAEIKAKQQEMHTADQETVKLAINSLRTTMLNITGDILFLSKLPRLMIAINTPTATNVADLAETFSVFLEAKNTYYKIRWIDETGLEKVCVNLNNGHAQVIPPEELQDKSKRLFFNQASQLREGDLYLSKFDLNVEHEQIEFPYNPTIRAAMPLFDAKGQRRGLIVLNYNGQNIVDDLISSIGTLSKYFVMLNRDSYFLYNLNPDLLWGFMLNKPTTLGNQDPEVWASMQNSAQGTLTTNSGSWLWGSIHPLETIRSHHSLIFKPQAIKGDYDYYWHLAMLRPKAELDALNKSVLLRESIVIGLLTVLALIYSASIARSKLRIVRLDSQLMERAKAAESATEAKSYFIANMSHEIRTPMNAILGLAYLLEKSSLSGDANEMVRKIRMAGHSLMGIINDILDVSKIESGSLQIEYASFRLIAEHESLWNLEGG